MMPLVWSMVALAVVFAVGNLHAIACEMHVLAVDSNEDEVERGDWQSRLLYRYSVHDAQPMRRVQRQGW